MTDKTLTIIIPAYNEEKGIRKSINSLISECDMDDFQILVINDGSDDKTGLYLKKIKGIRVINHPYNKGYGAALKTGIKFAKSEYVAFFDADGQHSCQDLLSLWNNIENYDMIVGERGRNSHLDWIRIPGKFVLSKTANFLVGKNIPDLNSGLRIIKRSEILRMIHLLPDSFSLTSTVTVAFFSFGLNVGYYPIQVSKRIGKSTVNQLKHGTQTLLLILRLMVLFNPLKVFLSMSLLFFISAVLYELYFGIFLLYPDIKLLPTALFLFISSLLFFFFGLVVDQISEMRKNNI